MEPAAERWEHHSALQIKPGGGNQPQWSPPLNGGSTHNVTVTVSGYYTPQ